MKGLLKYQEQFIGIYLDTSKILIYEKFLIFE